MEWNGIPRSGSQRLFGQINVMPPQGPDSMWSYSELIHQRAEKESQCLKVV